MSPELYKAFLSFVTHNRTSDVFRVVSAPLSAVDVNHNNGEPVKLACSLGYIGMVKALVRLGADILPIKDECLALVPPQYKARLEHIIWNLESGVEARKI